MNILLLGSGGFIGRNLLEYLKKFKEYQVWSPSSKELDGLSFMQVKSYLEQISFDVVINAAIYNPRTDANKDVHKELENNLRLFYNFANLSSLYGKMLYFGSGAEYNKAYDIVSVKEDEVVMEAPMSDYGFAKYIINDYIKHSRNIYNLRIFGLFGKYENWKRTFISGACCKALYGVPITIRQNVLFDYLFIDDFVRIVKTFIEKEQKFHEYNVVSGKKIDLISIAESVKKISKKDIPIFVCNEGMGREYTADATRMLQEYPECKFTDLDEAITSLYNYYKENIDMISLEDLLYQ